MTKQPLGLGGLVVLDGDLEILAARGHGTDRRIQALATDSDWLSDAADKRLVPVILNDMRLAALVTPFADGTLITLDAPQQDTVLDFLLSVDFAYDILHHVLTDPFDAMTVIDGDAKLVFLSPVHEHFFKMQHGDGIGRPVRDVIENTRLHHVVRTGVAEVGQLQKMRGQERIVSRHPVRRNGEIVGAIGRIMFKGPEQVETLSRKVNALEKEIATYRSRSAEQKIGDKVLETIVGNSPAIMSLRDQIRKIAPLDIPVLIQGESGTGKELVARALHMCSTRSEGALVTVNAAALPATLVESELFGYESGSFTGADRKGRRGKFEQADKGTIFLDEIGDMPLEVQSKLLRVLQDRVVERVGGDKPRRIDFRLCSATNRDLEQFVEQEKFRLDLFYRISPVTLRVPPLEERTEDIPLLTRHFIDEISRNFGRRPPKVHPDVFPHLRQRRWPGNVRQLRHELERALAFNEGDMLTVKDFGDLSEQTAIAEHQKLRRPAQRNARSLKDALEELEEEMIQDAMTRFSGNKKKVAEHLKISRSYLYKKLSVSEELED